VRGTPRPLLPFFRRQWRALAVAGFGTIVVAAAELARPFPLKLVIDKLLDDTHVKLGDIDMRWLAIIVALVLLIALVGAVASYLVDVELMRAGERIMHDLRVATYDHLQRLALTYHERRHAGDLVTRVTGDVAAIGSLFSDSIGTIVAAGLSLLGMVVVSFAIDPLVALAAFAVGPPLAYITFRFRRRVKDVARLQRAKEGEIASMTTEALSAVKVVKAFGSEWLEQRRLAAKSEERRAAGIEASQMEGRFAGFIDVLGAVGTALVLGVGVVRVVHHALTPGDLVIMVDYARRLYRPLRDIARQTGRMASGVVRAERVADVLAADDVLTESPHAYSGARARGALELRSVSFSYGSRRPALHDVSLHIPAGQRLAIIGPSGAGKSTLAALMARFYDPQSGRVLIDDRDVRDCSLSWLRDQVGMVLQDTVLFTGSVYDNIAYGTEANEQEVIAAAKAAGAHGFTLELPDGYDTQLGPRGIGLSGGQRQRIAIARTLLRDPPVLILDEPTTGLDLESQAHVLRGLDVLMRGRTVVMITHDLGLASSADRVIVIDRGEVAREGPADVLLADERTLAETSPAASTRPPDGNPTVVDPALPQLPLLLDGERIEPVLRRSLYRERELHVRAHYLRYKPGKNLIAHYEVGIGGSRHDAVAMIAADADLRRWANEPVNVALARRVDGRSPSFMPLFHDRRHDVLVQWLPLDLTMPSLAEPARSLHRMLKERSLEVPDDVGEPERLSYKPQRKAALALGEHVLKIYAWESDFRVAADALASSSGLAHIRTATVEAALPELRMTVQARLPGRPVTDPIETADEAGRVLRRLHGAGFSRDPTVALRSEDQLQRATASARMAGDIFPPLRARVGRLIDQLASARPSSERLAASHGDFHAGQLLLLNGDAALIDFDEMCYAPAALDHATYAAHLVNGDEESLKFAEEALERLLGGYGSRPPDLAWYFATSILRRAPFPFRYFDERWPERMEGMVQAAESVFRAGAGE
jgi:ATP-binding cassette, subfamily B, bacterial